MRYTKRKGNLSFGSVKGPNKCKGLREEFYGLIKSRKRSIFVIGCHLNESAFTSVKRDAKLLNRYVKGVPCVNRRYTKEVLFYVKSGI